MICPFRNDSSTGTIQYFEHGKLVMELEGDRKEKRKWRLYTQIDTLTGLSNTFSDDPAYNSG